MTTQPATIPGVYLTREESHHLVIAAVRAANDAHVHLGMCYASDNRTAATACVMRTRRAYLATLAPTLQLWNSLQSWPHPDNAASCYERATDYREDARHATLAAIRSAKRHPKQ